MSVIDFTVGSFAPLSVNWKIRRLLNVTRKIRGVSGLTKPADPLLVHTVTITARCEPGLSLNKASEPVQVATFEKVKLLRLKFLFVALNSHCPKKAMGTGRTVHDLPLVKRRVIVILDPNTSPHLAMSSSRDYTKLSVPLLSSHPKTPANKALSHYNLL